MKTAINNIAEETSRDVTALRKAGKVDEAVVLGRVVYARNPQDKWAVSALAWALYAKFKAEKNTEQKQGCAAEFLALPLPVDDEYFAHVLPIVQRSVDLLASRVGGLTERSKVGQEEAAVEGLLRLTREEGFDPYMVDSFGWCIVRWLLHAKVECLHSGMVVHALNEYMRLRPSPLASTLHSTLLTAILRSRKALPSLLSVLRWWNVDKLQENDWEPYRSAQGKTIACVAERLAGAVFKQVRAMPRELPIDEWIIPFVETVYRKCSRSAYAAYYYGALLAREGRGDEGRIALISLVKRKRNDFWAWCALAETVNSTKDKLVLLSRAFMCPYRDESLRVSLYESLAEAMVAEGCFVEARVMLDRAVAIRESKEWKLSSSIQCLCRQEWYASAVGNVNVRTFCEKKARAVDALLNGFSRK